MAIGVEKRFAVWVITPNGLGLARRLQKKWPSAALFCSRRISAVDQVAGLERFDRLTDAVAAQFNRYDGHIFIMATGIVVRAIAGHLHHKTSDPAVVVVDDRGQFSISLTSGHLGGANRLAREAADHLNATAVITTATDVNEKPAIDTLAVTNGLKIENPECIKAVNMALLTGAPIRFSDQGGWLTERLPNSTPFDPDLFGERVGKGHAAGVGVWVGDTICDPGPDVLVLRPKSLAVGIGCNRNTPLEEIRDHLFQVLHKFELAPVSLSSIASIDLKSDEEGICALASELRLPLRFFTKDELSMVEDVPTPSVVVEKHIGVSSVCEAAAILSSPNGRLIVPKQSGKNVTVAIARKASMSSE